MTRGVPTPDDKQEALTDLLYDYGMLLGCRLELGLSRKQAKEAREQLYRNALLESMAIRWRALMDFFYGHERTRWKDDICAEDYISSWASSHATATHSDYENLRKRVDKQIAHIGRQRVLQRTKKGNIDESFFNEKNWNSARLVTIANGLMRDFDAQQGADLAKSDALEWGVWWEQNLAKHDPHFLPALTVATANC